MQWPRKSVGETISRIFSSFRGDETFSNHATDALPVRMSPYSVEQIEERGKALAGEHRLKSGASPERLLIRLSHNEKVLHEVHANLVADVKAGRSIVPAGEWLLDNFYVIEEQINTARRHLPKGYSRELPYLANTSSSGLPRVYDIAWELILRGDGHIDPHALKALIDAYQSISTLKLGELWAIPIMLRLAIIENLRRVAEQVDQNRQQRINADRWADQMIDVASNRPRDLILVIADMARATPEPPSCFVAELARRLRGSGPALALPLTWISQRLAEADSTIEQSVSLENQLQASYQVSMCNSIGSLRTVEAMNWRGFVEETSLVERTLAQDPAGVYCRMDFATRDYYRHAVERIARRSPLSEEEVAASAVLLASEARDGGTTEADERERETHVGYYLIGKALKRLERRVGMKGSLAGFAFKFRTHFPLPLYVGSILLLTALFVWGLLDKANADGADGWALLLVGLLSFFCTADLAIALINWIFTLTLKPRPLPRMDFSAGLPGDARTFIVVPTMLTGKQTALELVRELEVRYLGNCDKNLYFGLLTDFPDADTESTPEDEPLLQLIRQRIEELNARYRKGEDIFFLLHRPRLWNPREEAWMGYERKRGKLKDLNDFLRGKGTDRFSVIVGNTAALKNIEYVITLDTDTLMARDSARQFVGAMAHPLNRPYYDEQAGRIVEGYGILQPRVAEVLGDAKRSLYSRIFSPEIGIDPYTQAVSNVYQDLFEEGSFIGKGIYSIDAFEKTMAGKLPENRILSHDLLEGCYVRSGLLSDLLLYEESPSNYLSDVIRKRRWIRGDWQIASWALPKVPTADGSVQKNPLSLLSRWKIADNLRRSLTPAGLMLLLLLGWTVFPAHLFWTVVAIGITTIPTLASFLLALCTKPQDVTVGQHVGRVLRRTPQYFSQIAFSITCLPYEAYFSLDSIVRSICRMTITRKRLLEWKTAAESNRSSGTDLLSFLRHMWIGPVVSVLAGILLVHSFPTALWSAVPLLILWLLSPAIAWKLSQPAARTREMLTAAQDAFLRRVARKTWAFFETFVGPEDNWLPPDNYQEYPEEKVAHRTSPTNMGLSLLANLGACDFGFITAGRCMDRIKKAFATMEGLERHKGHFLNWYDTVTLQALPPRYVSSVDSGNLVGHLLTLRAGLREFSDSKIIEPRFFDGLAIALDIALEAETDASTPKRDTNLTLLKRMRKDLKSLALSPPATLTVLRISLEQLSSNAAKALAGQDAVLDGHIKRWVEVFIRQCRDALDELNFLTPWAWRQNGFRNIPELEEIPTLSGLAKLEERLFPILTRLRLDTPAAESNTAEKAEQLRALISTGSRHAKERLEKLRELREKCTAFSQIDYDFLLNHARNLLTIGYNVDELRADGSYYDLLASEARLATFVGIAQGSLPQECWFAMGRRLTTINGAPVLLSWSGSMFEYLMPTLVMPSYEDTLLDETCRTAVRRQIAYARRFNLPWGISESGYNAYDAQRNYQYHAFGVPGLGLKRGLSDDLVIAPYASALALMVMPGEACRNLLKMAGEGFQGRYGFYEAVDYTSSRLQRGQNRAIVQSFMAHHQGMLFLAIDNALKNAPMQKRFAAEPLFESTLLLLQERVPETASSYAHTAVYPEFHAASETDEPSIRIFDTPDTAMPQVQLLSNGRYHVMLTNAGGGYSRWNDLAVTRWHEDATCDNWGTFCYLRDVTSGTFWSNAHQPTLQKAKSYEAVFSEGRAEYHCRNHGYDTHTEIAVSPEDDVELRRIRITNRALTRRDIETTSYAEVVLAPPIADASHPAFSNLFVQTEILHDQGAILCTRRPRAPEEHTPWMFHLMAVHGAETEDISFETDRQRFLGRGGSIENPQALAEGSGPLSGTAGSVLDPIVSVRSRVFLDPEASVVIDVVTGVAENRDAAVALVEKYRENHMADRVCDMAWTHGQVLLRQLNITEAEAQLYCSLASSIIYMNRSLRAAPDVVARNNRGQSGLWGYSISGDLPIVLLQIADADNVGIVKELVQAHSYWRLKGLPTDLMIWNEDQGGYRQILHDHITALITAENGPEGNGGRGGVYLRPGGWMSEEDRILFQAVARVVLCDDRGTLAEQTHRRQPIRPLPPLLAVAEAEEDNRQERPVTPEPRTDLLHYNGMGGFTQDGREYVITTSKGVQLPAPWCNVIANPDFGSVLYESGLAYTWSENAHEFRLTPWNNDAINDCTGEAYYLRDEENGRFWSPTPRPASGLTPYVARHGFGYSVFEHEEQGLRTEMQVYVDIEAPVKYVVLKIRNESEKKRRLSATGYVEWVLGDLREKTGMHILTERDAESGTLYARNPYSPEFPERTAFFHLLGPDGADSSFTCDRTEFLGRNGSLAAPSAMRRARLSGRSGAGLDAAAAVQTVFDLEQGGERTVIFRLGNGKNPADARAAAAGTAGAEFARAALEKVWAHWSQTLGAVHVETPDSAFDVLANGWLLYQTIACRMWARSGHYQSGGAFGFRDQLQDALALVHTEPHLLRSQILRCAARQFVEGDVQHWWHPPLGRGVRTRCSDDYLWLPLATYRYVFATGDTGILEEKAGFLQGRPLREGEESYYDLPAESGESGTLYEHCLRSIRHGLRFGVHGLPLIGSGDWNDGMDRVGIEGRGESVWLGFFLYEVLLRFATIADGRSDEQTAALCREEAAKLQKNLDEQAWDGEWYRRAYFDDGTPIGSSSNAECRIDSISQSWSILSGAGDSERAKQAMESLYQRLVLREGKLVKLLDPPFDISPVNPGYIKGYVPGVRENGGQYTHAAIWAAMAFSRMGDSRRAWDLTALINPVNHGRTPEEISIYKVEPYVLSADVYAAPQHIGRGGWSWYTGSSAWMYRLMVESILGITRETNHLRIAPCLPEEWKGVTVHYRFYETAYRISILRAEGEGAAVILDGAAQEGNRIPLEDDRNMHVVEVRI